METLGNRTALRDYAIWLVGSVTWGAVPARSRDEAEKRNSSMLPIKGSWKQTYMRKMFNPFAFTNKAEGGKIIFQDNSSFSRTFYFFSHFPCVFHDWKIGQSFSRFSRFSRTRGNPDSYWTQWKVNDETPFITFLLSNNKNGLHYSFMWKRLTNENIYLK